MLVDPFDLIQKYYDPSSLSYRVLIQHSTMVTATSLAIARRRNDHNPDQQVDIQFIYEAAMVHDIGIYAVYAPVM